MSEYIGDTLVSGVGRSVVKNAHNLLDFIWSDHIINSMEWLRSDAFSWQSGEVYTSVYNHLVADLVDATASIETVGSYSLTVYTATDGHKIVLDDEESTVASIFNDYGVAWYYIVDTTNTRFKLPRMNPSKELSIITANVITGSDHLTSYDTDLPAMKMVSSTGATKNKVLNWETSTGNVGYGGDSGITNVGYFQPSNLITDFTDTEGIYKGKKYLYFYVGQFSQTATEQTAGITTEQLNAKVDLDLNNINPSQTAKETIVGWNVPDYSAGVSKTSATEYVAETNGTIMAQCYRGSQSGGTTISCIINGTTLPFVPEATDYGRSQIYLKIKKGDIYKITTNDGIYFFPDRS